MVSKGRYLDAHVVLFLTRVSFADIFIQFKKATKISKRLEVGFNGDVVKATLENTDGLTHRWTLERDMCVILKKANRVLTPPIVLQPYISDFH